MTPHIDNEAIAAFIERQIAAWPLAAANYARLGDTERRIFRLGDLPVAVQYNPAREVSTGAKTDKESIASRPCFLCKRNRPAEQESIPFPDGWEWLVNPYPIFPVHFTIASKEHEPQAAMPLDMVAAAETAPALAFFFNGATAGASAPDHLHFQAIRKDELPLLDMICSLHTPDKPGIVLSTDLDADLPVNFWSAIVTPDLEGMQTLALLPELCGFDADSGNPSAGMVNAFVFMDGGLLRAAVIPRKRHRPDQYYTDGDSRLLVSPGAIDMAGIIITPRRTDFERMTADDIRDIYAQTGLSADELRSRSNTLGLS